MVLLKKMRTLSLVNHDVTPNEEVDPSRILFGDEIAFMGAFFGEMPGFPRFLALGLLSGMGDLLMATCNLGGDDISSTDRVMESQVPVSTHKGMIEEEVRRAFLGIMCYNEQFVIFAKISNYNLLPRDMMITFLQCVMFQVKKYKSRFTVSMTHRGALETISHISKDTPNIAYILQKPLPMLSMLSSLAQSTCPDIAVKILWVESGMRGATIQDDQVIVNKTDYEEKKARGKKVDTKEGTTLGPDKIDATGGAMAVLKRQVLRKEGNDVSSVLTYQSSVCSFSYKNKLFKKKIIGTF